MGRFFKVTPTETMSQYVEMPLDFMYQQLQGKQQKLDEAKAYDPQLRGLLDAEVDPLYDAQELQAKQEYYNNKIDEYSKALANTGSVNQALTHVQDIQREISQDRWLKEAPENWKKIQKDQEAYKEALAKGNVGDWNKRFDDYYFSGSKWKGTKGDDGTNIYQPGALYYENQDHQKAANEFMGSINYDGYDFSNAVYTADGFKVTSKNGKDYLDDKKVMGLAANKSGDFLDSQAGHDWVRKTIFDRTGERVDNGNWNTYDQATKDFLQKSATQYLYNAAEEQIFARTNTGTDKSYDQGYVHDKKEEEANNLQGTTLGLNIQEQPWLKAKIDGLKQLGKTFSFDKSGQFGGIFEQITQLAKGKGYTFTSDGLGQKNGVTVSMETVISDVIDSNPTFKKNFDKVMDNFSATNEEFAKLPDAQKWSALMQGATSMLERPVLTRVYTVDNQKQATERVLSSSNTREFISLEGDGDGRSYSLDDITKKLGIKGEVKTQQDLLKYGTIIGEAHGVPTQNGAKSVYTLQILDSKGNAHNYGVQMDNEVNSQYNAYNRISTEMNNLNYDFFTKGIEKNEPLTMITYDDNKVMHENQLIPSIQIDNNNNIHTGVYVASKEKGRTYYYKNDKSRVDVTDYSLKQKQDLIKTGNLMFMDKEELDTEMQRSMDNDPYVGTGKSWIYKAADVEQ